MKIDLAVLAVTIAKLLEENLARPDEEQFQIRYAYYTLAREVAWQLQVEYGKKFDYDGFLKSCGFSPWNLSRGISYQKPKGKSYE